MANNSDILELVRTERRRSLLRNLNLLRDENCLTDVRLVVDGHVFPAHRLLLAANSLYFREVFDVKPNVKKITIGDVDVDVFATVLNYLYTGRLTGPASRDLSKIRALLSAFKSLRIVNYQKVTAEVVLNTLGVETFYNLWTIAKSITQKPVEQEIVQFVAKNLERCSQNENFWLLTLAQMISIMASAWVRKQPPDVVLAAVSGWSDAEPEKRKKYLCSLLSVVGLRSYVEKCESMICNLSPRLTYRSTLCDTSLKHTCTSEITPISPKSDCSPNVGDRQVCSAPTSTTISNTSLTSRPISQSFSVETYKNITRGTVAGDGEQLEQINVQHFWENGTLLENSVSPDESLTDSVAYSSQNPAAKSDSDDLDVLPVRQPADQDSCPVDRACIMFIGQDDISLPVQAFYDYQRKRWMPIEVTIRVIGDNVTILLYKRCLYYFGGELPGHEPLNSVHVHMLDNHTLTQIASMSVARSCAGAVCCADKMYIVGGLTSHSELLDDVERYDPDEDSWETLPNLLFARCNPSVASTYLGVYVVSGFLDEYNVEICFSCEFFSLMSGQWSEIASMPTGICALPTAVTAIDDDIYLIRLMKPNKIYQYNASNDEWRMVCQCNNNEIQVVATLNVEGWLWVVDSKQRVFKFNFELEEWEMVTHVSESVYPPLAVFVLQEAI